MKNEQKKLKEYMYLSLIAKNYGTQIVDGTKYVCFTRNYGKTGKDEIIPLYLTSTQLDSDKVLLKRVKNFEQKIFGNLKGSNKLFENLNKITAEEGNKDSVCFVRRMKEFFAVLKDEDKLFALDNYRKNLEALAKEEIISDEEAKIMDEFATKMVLKEKINIQELTR